MDYSIDGLQNTGQVLASLSPMNGHIPRVYLLISFPPFSIYSQTRGSGAYSDYPGCLITQAQAQCTSVRMHGYSRGRSCPVNQKADGVNRERRYAGQKTTRILGNFASLVVFIHVCLVLSVSLCFHFTPPLTTSTGVLRCSLSKHKAV